MSLPNVQHGGGHGKSDHPKTTKGGTKAERVVWMSRTSDVLGSHMKTDLESYLTLIRRKIQEKCANTMELIRQIRRNKIGESGHVTPNEFRFTLIKFGIILPQPLVDRIFNVFDSDRSGTMDFDEFAMWIMNSEFRPAFSVKKTDNVDSPATTLRKKFQACVQQHGRVFANMKKQVSFLEFVSDINRKNMDLTDKEARTVFQTLDPKDTGFVDTAALLRWADTGRLEPCSTVAASKPNGIRARSLEELITKVVGRNSRQLESSFSHIQLGQGTKIPFDEFRRCLLNAGVGKNIHDSRQLFDALSGGSNVADIDLFFRSLSPIVVDPDAEVSVKQVPSSSISASRADRHLRDALRKSFKEVKAEVEAADQTSCGFVDAEVLYRILVKRCMPLTFQDFRFILQQIRKEPGTTRVDYVHFLHGYNPTIAPHLLAGPATLRTYGQEPATAPSPSNKASMGKSGKNSHASTASHNSLPGEIGPEFTLMDQSQLLKRAKATIKQKQAAMDDSAMSRTSSRGNFGASSSSMRRVATAAGTGFNNGSNSNSGEGADLKRVWHAVLRECHRSDPDRSGQVNRTQFISALEKANLNQSMSAEAMSKLADQYTLSNGLVNYLYLFRSYLNDITGMAAAAVAATGNNSSGYNNNSGGNTMGKSKSMPGLDGTGGGGGGALSKSGELKPIHPWEFDYKREKHDAPYWRTAGTMARDSAAGHASVERAAMLSAIASPNERSAQYLNVTERDAILSQYNAKTLDLCCKCYQLFAPIWRPLRNHFKKAQITSQRGSILTSQFLSILESNGLALSKTELGLIVRVFRGLGLQDVVKYDDFMRVCLLVKDRDVVVSSAAAV